MKIDYVKLETLDNSVFNIIAEWYNDMELNTMLIPQIMNAKFYEITPEELKYQSHVNKSKTTFIIKDENTYVGECSIDMAYPHIMRKDYNTAWISLCIGNKAYWRIGVGTQTILFLEEMSRIMGAERIELGVFDYNLRAKKLYTKMGYQPFLTLENVVHYQNRWHHDVRMEKFSR